MTEPLDVQPDTKALAAKVGDPAHPRLEARFEYAGDRRWPQTLRLVGFAVGPAAPLATSDYEGLTVTAIRDLPVARWQSAAHASLTAELRRALEGTQKPIASYVRDTPRAAAAMSRLLQVAHLYRLNVAAGLRDPVATIAREAGVKPSTAASWVFRARKAGLLGPASGRTAGELPSTGEES